VTLSCPVQSFSLVNSSEERVVEPGEFVAIIGSSSADARVSLPFRVE
jgi:hypothetical protein